MATVEGFLVEYPEFAETDEGLIQAKLQRAVENHQSPLWGSNQEEAIYLYTAHMLAMRLAQMSELAGLGASAAGGQGAALTSKGENLSLTTYGLLYKEISDGLPASGFATGSYEG